MKSTEILGLVLGVLGLFGFTTLISFATWTQFMTRAHRYLRLARRQPLEIVLVTSSLEEGGVEGARYKRPTSSFHTLRAATQFAEQLGALRKRKPLRVSISERLTAAPDGDLVLLGDPSKNVLGKHFLAYFNAVNAEHGLEIDRTSTRVPSTPRVEYRSRVWRHLGGRTTRLSTPATVRSIFRLRVGEKLVAEYELSPQGDSGSPSSDIGLIVAWLSPFSLEKRRAVLCAGWTSHGTAAAADYYLNQLPSVRYQQLRREGRLPRLYSKRWPCFICVVEVALIGEQVVSVNEVFFAQVPDELPSTRLRGRSWLQTIAPDIAQGNRDRDRAAD